MRKLAIITTHPIQYYAPVFKLLHQRQNIAIKVFYTWGEASTDKHDPGFAKKVIWDIPLLDGYPYEWMHNTATDPGSHHFNGIINPDLINQLKAFEPDAVLVIGWAYNSHLKAIRYFKNKVPIWFRGDSTLLDETGGIRAVLKNIFLKWVYRHIDHAFYNGINNKAYFKKYGLKDKQLTFAPHAIDNDRFATERQEEVAILRQSLGLTAADTLTLFAGKLEKKKDPELLLEAIIALNSTNIHLLFTGSGELEKLLKEKAWGNNNIHFIDFQNQSNMPVIYQACDLFCLPSKGPGETWGLAVNEAMACSKAVLVSDKCGCAIDLVKNAENGAIFKNGSLDDIVNHLKILTSNKNLLIDYGVASHSIIKTFNFLNIAKAIEENFMHEAYR